MSTALPDFVPPMLAKLGEPFDSPDYQFEIKWDGVRALTFAERGDLRMFTRNRNPLAERYPELDFLRELPSGTVLDGELIVMVDGMPSIGGILRREQARDPRRINALRTEAPVTYVVFDLLYREGSDFTDQVLTQRREALAEIVASMQEPRLVFSEAIDTNGTQLFEESVKRELEGIVAKRKKSKYLPGKRTESWIKIKRTQRTYCAILGYLAENDEIRSLVVGVERQGELTYAGRVGSGLDTDARRKLQELFRNRVRDSPLIPVPKAAGPAVWVEPGVYCTVKFLEMTAAGEFRAPVFEELVEE